MPAWVLQSDNGERNGCLHHASFRRPCLDSLEFKVVLTDLFEENCVESLFFDFSFNKFKESELCFCCMILIYSPLALFLFCTIAETMICNQSRTSHQCKK